MKSKTALFMLASLGGFVGGAEAVDVERATVTLADTQGAEHRLVAPAEGKAAVLYFASVQCSRCNRYQQRLVALEKKYRDQGIAFFAVYSHAYDSATEIDKQRRDGALAVPTLLDPDQRAAAAFKVTITPTVVVIDAQSEVLYRGAIDDNVAEPLAGKHYLRDAIDAVIAGEAVAVSETSTVGCSIQHRTVEQPQREVTYASHVAGILFQHCAVCHRPGQIGPFSLLTYDQARRWSDNIVAFTQARSMPPWKPQNQDCFRGERRISDEEVATLAQWVADGSPQGDAAQTPAPPQFHEGWALGEPDLVLETPEYELESHGADEYRSFVLDPKLLKNRDVVAIEYKPGNAQVVHHIISYIDGIGISKIYDGNDGKPGYASGGTGQRFIPLGDLGGWGPGGQPVSYPDGMGQTIPAGAKIVLEIHYHKSGKTEKDQTKMGLHFAKKPVPQQIKSHVVLNMVFEIPPGESHHQVRATWKVKEDILAVAIQPHMHLIGREIRVTAKLPDKTKLTLVEIKDWDFNWQEMYYFQQPITLPAGTVVELMSWFDNSTDNPNNPNKPPKPVRFGLSTTDEMAVAYIAYTRLEQK
ncbi:MAG TPA: redoxin domain-containing protein [Pirellulales bacterium]|nr:redoxin domain-containing protein [Pirellulales bacterium]